MRTKIHKLFWAWEYEKEEKWLDSMSDKGLALVNTGFCTYWFEGCQPGEYSYQIELLENSPKSMKGQKYIDFLEETGAEHVGRYLRWCYFRKKRTDGQFELYSDPDDKIRYMNRILKMLVPLCILNIFNGINNITMGLFNHYKHLEISNITIGAICLIVGLMIADNCAALNIRKKRIKMQQQFFEN